MTARTTQEHNALASVLDAMPPARLTAGFAPLPQDHEDGHQADDRAPAAAEPARAPEWPMPMVGGAVPPDIPADVLPGWLGQFVGALCEATQTPPTMAVGFALSVLAACVQRRYVVQVHEGYTEPTPLWSLTVAPSGSRKSAIKAALVAPLEAWERRAGERMRREIADNNARIGVAEAIIKRLVGRYDSRILKALIEAPKLTRETFADPARLQEWIIPFQTQLNRFAESGISLRADVISSQTPARLHVQIEQHANLIHNYFDANFADSPEYRKIAAFGDEIHGLLQDGAYFENSKSRVYVQYFGDVINALFAEGKKAYEIQRYKGLGEMNPEQLWETTLDPAVRRMLQVKLQDAMAADEIFTTLMGEEVEPRRAFIEDNAINATIDI